MSNPRVAPPASTLPGYNPQRRITVNSGLRHQAADEGLAALGAAGVPFYQRGGALVRVSRIKARASDKTPILVPGIISVRLPLLRRALGQSAYWEKPDKEGEVFRIDPPKDVAEQIAEMIEEWPFKPLVGVIGCPTLRPDGSLLDRLGYDEATGLVLENSVAMPAIAARPCKEDAARALKFIEELLAEFPLRQDDPAGAAVVRSQVITPVIRGAMPAAPMHLTSAPEAGTGKSYLADITAMIATGDRCPVIALTGQPEEGEKRLLGAALSGTPIIGLDNVGRTLEGDFLCQATERPVLLLRGLGSSIMHRIDNNFTVLANGNNAGVADDLVRRTIRAQLDANLEDPESRTFKADPLAMVRANRGKYIAACLTIPRAYLAEGKPDPRPRLSSYEAWSDLVRSPLVWLGCADPVETMQAARDNDPHRVARRSVFTAWQTWLGVRQGYLIAELLSRSGHLPELRSAFLGVAKDKKDDNLIDPMRLAWWLRKNENTVVGDLKLMADRSDKQRPTWLLVART